MLPDLHHVKITISMHFLLKKKRFYLNVLISIFVNYFFLKYLVSLFCITDVNGLLKIH